MCNFCVQHGDGQRWYVNARNYALDMESDLRRRGFIVDFIRNFEANRRTVNAGLKALRFVPRPAHTWLAQRASTALQENHFGQPVPIEECAHIFDIATNITRLPCVCRGAMKAGSNAESCCIIMTVNPSNELLDEGFHDYAGGPQAEGFQRLTTGEAVAYLRRAEERGLCHTAWTFITPFIAAICNCNLPSGCMAMKIQITGGVRIMWKGEDVARLNRDLCSNCGRCTKQCPFGAIGADKRSGRIRVDRMLCWGCGICRGVCQSGALALEQRSATADVSMIW
jgi:ferredoxin